MSASPKQQYLVRIGALQNFDQLCIELGIDPNPVLRRLGLNRKYLETGDLLVEVGRIASALEFVTRLSNRDDIPPLLALDQNRDFLGDYGHLLTSSANMEEFLLEQRAFLYTHAQPVRSEFEVEGDLVRVSFEVIAPHLSALQLDLGVKLTLSQFRMVTNRAAGKVLPLRRVCFRSKVPDYLSTYQSMFGDELEFDADFDGLYFNAEIFKWEIQTANTTLHHYAKERISKIAPESDFIDQLEGLVRFHLPTQKASLTTLANQLGCSERTIQRRLDAHGQESFQSLLDRVRFEIAEQYLVVSNLPMTEIAYAVGYSDQANFTRAFSKYTGSSPSQFRKQRSSG